MKKLNLLIIHTLPLFLGILLSYFFWQSNFLLLVLYILLVIGLIITGKDAKIEWLIFIYGAIIGFIIETIGTSISGYQSFAQPDIWGIPYWLIVAWAYGFILMKRISLIIATNSPWTK